jgi:two-component system, NtrC family, sensor kinase
MTESNEQSVKGDILLVDDTPANLRLLSRMLSEQGYKVRSVISGSMALTAVNAARPDLILLDINMPGMSGYEVCRQLKADDHTRQSPVIFISALDEPVDKVKAFNVGGVDYITKPFHIEEVLARVETQLALHRQRQELQERYEEIQRLQIQLVEQEKMAALGALVAGISHEINTPIGIGVMAASLLEEETRHFVALYDEDQMKRSDLSRFLQTAAESSAILLGNLNRAAELVQSFKQVAVDQSSEERRVFQLDSYLGDALIHLSPELKRGNHTVEIQGETGVTIESYPGVWAQIVTNLVMNSLMHAYEPEQAGRLIIDLRRENGRLLFQYRDDGRGIPAENLGKIFDPFFTTRRGQGGSGLGLHIIYNLVTQKLGGVIRCESAEGRGTTFYLDVPSPNPRRNEE